MKRALLLLMTIWMLGACVAQGEVKLDTMTNGKIAEIWSKDGQQLGIAILATDSTPSKTLLVPEMDIPFVEYGFQADQDTIRKVHVNIHTIIDTFFKNLELEVFGTCTREDILADTTIFPDRVIFTDVYLSQQWFYADSTILLRLCFEILGDRYWGGPAINIFREFDLKGNRLRDFSLMGLGNEGFELSQNGHYALVFNGVLGEVASWAPCETLGRLLWDIREKKLMHNCYSTPFTLPVANSENYSSYTSLTGNTLVKKYCVRKREESAMEYYYVIDFRNRKGHFFGLSLTSSRTVIFEQDGIRYRDDSGEEICRQYNSPFFTHLTH